MTAPNRYHRRLSCRAAYFALSALAAAAVPAVLAASVSAQVIIEETTPGTTPTHLRPHRPRKKPTTPATATTATTAAKTPVSAYVMPKLLWRTLIQRAEGAPIGDGDTVFAAAGNSLYLLDSGGHTLRVAEIGATQSSPTLDTNRVYVGTEHGPVYGIDRHTGKNLWKFAGAGDSVLTTPAVGAGRLYVESSDNNVYGLAASTGGQIWKFSRPDGSLGYASPVYVPAEPLAVATNPATQQASFTGGADMLFACGDTTVYRLDPSTGHMTWHTPVGGRALSTPAVGGGRLYVGGDGPGLTALAVGDGHQLWAFSGKGEREWFGAPTVAEGTVYVATTDRYVYALDAATGRLRWATRLLTGSLACPALDARRHVVYVSSTTNAENPTLTALDARTGTKLWDAKIGSLYGAPLVAGDRLYAASTDGNLYCYSLK